MPRNRFGSISQFRFAPVESGILEEANSIALLRANKKPSFAI
jgi:hypothetical protein